MQLVDIGANLTHASFGADADEVIFRARQAGVSQIIVTGTTAEESRKALDLAARHSGLYSTAGVHPHHARECNSGTISSLKVLLEDPRVVAVGECGLDFNRNYSPHPAQEACFLAQLELGLALKKPLFLHSRDAHPRFAQVLKSSKVETAVAHCFTGGREELHAYLDLGLYIGITGWICDERRGMHLVPLMRGIPAGKLLLETDGPYLLPRDLAPKPASRRNEPAYLAHIAAAVARARGERLEELARSSTEGARELFRLPVV